MYITQVTVQGACDLPQLSLQGWGRVVRLAPGPAAAALFDALLLLWAALDPNRLDDHLRRIGLLAPGEASTHSGDPLPDEAVWQNPGPGRLLVADLHERNVVVTAGLALDPLLHGQLRLDLAREPRLLAALAEGGPLRLSVAALYNRDFTALSLHLRPLGLGEEEISLRTGERPPWADRLLHSLRPRLLLVDPADFLGPHRAVQAALSPVDHDRYLRFTQALLPDGPSLRAAHGPGDRPILLADERPLRCFGARIERRALAAAQVHLGGADVVLVDEEDPWVEGAVEGANSPVEQVIRLCTAGEPLQIATPTPVAPLAGRFGLRRTP